jgi:hypothetical protein
VVAAVAEAEAVAASLREAVVREAEAPAAVYAANSLR